MSSKFSPRVRAEAPAAPRPPSRDQAQGSAKCRRKALPSAAASGHRRASSLAQPQWPTAAHQARLAMRLKINATHNTQTNGFAISCEQARGSAVSLGKYIHSVSACVSASKAVLLLLNRCIHWVASGATADLHKFLLSLQITCYDCTTPRGTLASCVSDDRV